jgi:hypothetical protein
MKLIIFLLILTVLICSNVKIRDRGAAEWVQPVFNQAYDATITSMGDPNRPLYKEYRTERRDAVKQLASDRAGAYQPVKKQHDQLVDPRNFLERNIESAQKAAEFEDNENYLHAVLQHRTLPARGVFIPARTSAWQDTGKMVRKGEMIAGRGIVVSAYVDYQIGPNGIPIVPNEVEMYEPIARSNKCQAYSLCGRVGDQIFQIGTGAQVPASGELYAVVNVPYYGPFGPNTAMFSTRSDGGFDIIER